MKGRTFWLRNLCREFGIDCALVVLVLVAVVTLSAIWLIAVIGGLIALGAWWLTQRLNIRKES